MRKFNCKKLLAGVLGAAMLCTAMPYVGMTTPDFNSAWAADSEPQTTVIYSTDFEDGVNVFTGRDGQSQTAIVSTDSYSGTSCLESSGRSKNWHGPQILLDDMIEAGQEYVVSAQIKTPWYATVTLSLDYVDASGTRKYTNINSVVSQGGWVELPATKFSFPKGATNMYVYMECADTGVNIYVDDFKLTTAPVYPIQEDIASLKDVYSPYFKIGGAVTSSELAPASAQNLIKKHYNSLTPGNELKPESIIDKNACLEMAANGDDTNPQVDIAPAREILDFCRDNDIAVRGHVLVWHSQTPDWFFKENYDENADWVSKEKMLQRMENYIKNVFAALDAEYSDVDFYAWDVVNEAYLDNGSPRTGGTQAENSNYSGWVKVFGDNSFIEPAFEYARKYAPEGCKLYYNDFNEYMPAKTTAIVEMANSLKEKGLIDGIGMQSHLDVGFPTASAYKKALKAFCETGLDVQVTELDITTSDISEAGFEKQAQLYSDIMDACVEYADSISAVVFWGTTDDKSWRAAKCPLLFNEDFTAKPSYYSIIDGLEAVVPTEPVTEPTTEATTEPVTDDVTNPPELQFIPGDTVGDGVINVFDANAMRNNLITGKYMIDGFMASPYDVDGDGLMLVSDLVLLNKYLLGEDVELTYWKGVEEW